MKKLMLILLTVVMLAGIMPVSYAAENVYTVEAVYFSDLSGKELKNPSTSCVVNVELKKHAQRFGADTVVIASYSTDGAMIGFTTLAGSVANGESSTFSTLVISPTKKNIGVVKAYVWNNISEMKPLSAVKEVLVNEMDDGAVLPSLEEQPIRERYIPDTVTVVGEITDTYKSNNVLKKNEYQTGPLYMEPVIDDLYTEEEYFAYITRIEEISKYYEVFSGLRSGYNDGNSVNFIRSDFDLSDYLTEECRFTLRESNDGYFEVVNFEPPKENKNVKRLDAKDYLEIVSNKIYFNSETGSGRTGYKLDEEYELYINGCEYRADGIGELCKFLADAQGKIELVINSGYCSRIFIDYYELAKVAWVEYEDGVTTVVTAAAKNSIAPVTRIVVDDDYVKDEVTYIDVKKNGQTIELKELETGDIIACAFDLTMSNAAVDPHFIKIEASNRSVSGVVTGKDIEEEKCYIDGTAYSYVNDAIMDLSFRSKYKLKLDPFGRIYEGEELDAAE